MIAERSSGLWNRMIVSGVKPVHLLVSHIISGFIISVLQSTEICISFFFMLSDFNYNSMLLMFLLVVVNGFTGIIFGVLVSVICRSISESLYLIQFVFYTSCYLCGTKFIFSGLFIKCQTYESTPSPFSP